MAAKVVAPYVAQMDASGEGYVETIETATVTVTGITHVYGASAAADHALWAAFDLSDADPAAGEADFWIDLSESFVAALAGLMAGATGGKTTAAINLTTGFSDVADGAKKFDESLLDEITAEIENALNNNGALEFLEADTVGDLEMRVDWSGAAANMRNGLRAGAANSNLLRLMYLQIAAREANGDQATMSVATLGDILQANDAFSFIFDCTPSVQVEERAQAGVTDVSGDPSGNTVPGTNPDALLDYNAPANFGTGKRRVAFIITVA